MRKDYEGKELDIVFDNAGGATLIIPKDGYAHYYEAGYMQDLASDYLDYTDLGSALDWEGNDFDEIGDLRPTYEQIRNGGYREYTWSEGDPIAPNCNENQGWGNYQEFCDYIRRFFR